MLIDLLFKQIFPSGTMLTMQWDGRSPGSGGELVELPGPLVVKALTADATR